jgi:hypothetical protein
LSARRGGGAEGGDVGPVGFAGAVDDEAGDAGGAEIGEDATAVGAEPGVVEVAVGVEEGRHGGGIGEWPTKHTEYTEK